MAEIIKLRNDPHREVLELLPWFLTGTLETDERERVEAHLAQCADCREELAAERRLARAVKATSVDSDVASGTMDRRLHSAPPREPRQSSFWRKQVPLPWVVASPLAMAAAMALVAINLPSRPTEPVYRALGAADTVQPANLVVQFRPSTRVSDMQAALQSVDARFVDGPTQTGAYLLRVDERERRTAVKRLHENDAIALAEPIDEPTRE